MPQSVNLQQYKVIAGRRNGMTTIEHEHVTTLDRYLQLKQEGFEFEGQSYLFWEYIRILRDVRKNNPNVKFLLENVEMAANVSKARCISSFRSEPNPPVIIPAIIFLEVLWIAIILASYIACIKVPDAASIACAYLCVRFNSKSDIILIIAKSHTTYDKSESLICLSTCRYVIWQRSWKWIMLLCGFIWKQARKQGS